MKLTSKLSKCGDSLTVNMYDNGFMVEVSGRDDKDDWKTAKIMCPTLDDVVKVITEAAAMTRE
jgi:hypothetical protein